MADQLPIDSHLEQICSALDDHSMILIQAEPGSGKTTRVPLELARRNDGIVWVLEPRRLATTLAAEFVAEITGQPLGQFVGYKVRHDSKVSAQTRLTFMTEGMFLRLAQDPKEISRVATIVIDEFHERHLQTDVAYVICRRLQERNPALRIVLMSATLDTSSFPADCGTAIFEIPGRVFPVTTRYRPIDARQTRVEATVKAISDMAVDSDLQGNILAFLPGTAEIHRVCEGLSKLTGWQIIPLTSASSRRGASGLFTGKNQKVYVATNVAESSVTLPDIGGVVDTGVAKQPGFAPWSGLPTLDVKRVAQSSCIQRQGRAGRTRPGLCYRLFSEADFRGRPAFSVPEISRLDLAQVILQLLVVEENSGCTRPVDAAKWEWVDPPNEEHWQEAVELLRDLGALVEGKLTEAGRRMAGMPFHPRLAAIIEAASRDGMREIGIAVACLLNEGGIVRHGTRIRHVGNCDLAWQLNLWRGDGDRNLLDRAAVSRFEAELRLHGIRKEDLPGEFPAVGSLALAGFADRVAKKRTVKKFAADKDPKVTFNFCRGRGGVLGEQSCVRQHEFIVVLEASEDPSRRLAAEGSLIRAASSITREVLEVSPLARKVREHVWVENGQRVDAVVRIIYGNLILREQRSDDVSGGEDLLSAKLAEKWPGPFVDDADLRVLNNRIRCLKNANRDEGLEPFEGELFAVFLQIVADGKSSFREIGEKPLKKYLQDQVSYEHQGLLESLTPAEMKMPNGKTLPLEYLEDGSVTITGHLQDFYGVDQRLELPSLGTKIAAKILGPHGRPIQTTEDLPQFWRGGYAQVAKDLRGRYPKHYWPEAPYAAPPIRTKSRLPR